MQNKNIIKAGQYKLNPQKNFHVANSNQITHFRNEDSGNKKSDLNLSPYIFSISDFDPLCRTMAGRRTRTAVMASLEQNGFNPNSAKVVITGLSNTYSHYVTTYEEYQVHYCYVYHPQN